MPDKDDLDLLLDSALATYADPDPDSGPESGLAQRVLLSLTAVRAAAEGRRHATKPRRWLAWAVAVPLAASLLLWIGIGRFSHPPSSPPQQAHQIPPSASPYGSSSDTRPRADGTLKRHDAKVSGKTRIEAGLVTGRDFSRAASPAHSRQALAPEGRSFATTGVTRAPVPKLDVFPSPQPLTPQERVLVTAATRGSETEREALLEAAKPPSDAPLAIADLSIPPLVPPDEGKK
jgi:hypothetical protein